MQRIDEGSRDEVTRACLGPAASKGQQPARASSQQRPAACKRESCFSEVRWYLN